jgi:acetylornithine/N-succinyldiaminopimelate aminotransferase
MTDFREREAHSFFPTYNRLTPDIERAEGVYLFARDGRKYLDMFGGLAVNALGYGHSAILEAIERQMRRYVHLSNSFVQDVQVEFAERLLAASGFDRCFLCNSGTEGMEAALKLAKRWGKQNGKSAIFGLSGSFHGRTLGALSVTGRDAYRLGFEPLLPGTSILGFNDVESLQRNVDGQTLAVVVEPIQGEGGIHPVSAPFVSAILELRERYGFLLIADETQSGIGRTGKLFGYEHFGFTPDIVVAAKALGGGLPLGAMLGTERLADSLPRGTHGSTFGGNPVACAAGLAVLREVLDNGVMRNAAVVGQYLMDRLQSVAESYPLSIREVRGIGLMLGVEVASGGQAIVSGMLERGVVVNLTNNDVLRWLPPLIVTREQVDVAAGALQGAVLTIS